MSEFYMFGKELIPESQYQTTIESLKSDELLNDINFIKYNLKRKLIDAIKSRVSDEKFGIFFSGGIDSTVIAHICKELDFDFTCYTVGFKQGDMGEPADVTHAKILAKKYGFDLKVKVYDDATELIKETTDVLKGNVNVVTVGVGAVVMAAGKMAKEDGIKLMFSGLGSEEIFAGYERHLVEDINKECWTGLFSMWKRDLLRDVAISKYLGIGLATPFLDKDLIKFAMQIPAEFKIKDGYKKWILRKVAEEMGVDAWRKKKAAQYGSNFDKAIARLSKKDGLQKKEYLDSLGK